MGPSGRLSRAWSMPIPEASGRLPVVVSLAGLLWAAPGTVVSRAGPPAEETPFRLPPAPREPHLEFSADRFEYESSSSVIRLGGRVILTESTRTLRSDALRLDLATRRVSAAGFVEMDDGVSLVSGDGGEFDYPGGKGFVSGASAGFAPWRVRSRGAWLGEGGGRDLLFRGAWFTSCNEEHEPHYRLRASSLRVRPGRWLYAWNTVFYLGKAPVFYSPFLWKSLRRKHILRTRVSPGYDRRNGMSLRSTTRYSPASALLGEVYADYYGAQGLGLGHELELHRPGRSDGALYGYRIREDRPGRERWAVWGDHFEALPSSLSFQMRLQTQSDPEFNNHYSRSNSLRVTPELLNAAALVRGTRRSTARLSYSRADVGDPSRSGYARSMESAPRLEFRTAPLALPGSSVLHALQAFAESDFDRSRPFLRKAAGVSWSAVRVFPLLRGLSLTPELGYEEAYENRSDRLLGASTRTAVDAFTGRYRTGADLRVDTRLGALDIRQDFKRRSAPGRFGADASASDYGVEQNLLSLTQAVRPSRRVFFRLGSGYDWRVFRDRSRGFRGRVQPFTADASWLPRGGVSLALRDEYHLEEGNRSFAFQGDFGERAGRFLGLAASHNLASPRHYFAGSEFGWAPSSGTWRAGGALRAELRAQGGLELGGARLFEKELWLARDFHDFRAKALFRVRPGGVQEAQLRVELRLDKERPIRDKQDAPWRLWRPPERAP